VTEARNFSFAKADKNVKNTVMLWASTKKKERQNQFKHNPF